MSATPVVKDLKVYSIYSLELRYSKLRSSDFLSMLWCSNNVIIPTLQSRNTQCSVRFTAYFSQTHFLHLLLLTMHLDGSSLFRNFWDMLCTFRNLCWLSCKRCYRSQGDKEINTLLWMIQNSKICRCPTCT